MSFGASLDDVVREHQGGVLSSHRTWVRVPLGEVATVQNGFPFPSDQFSTATGVPLLRIRDISDSSTEAFFSGNYDSAYLIRLGDLVVGMDGDFHCALWKGPIALLNQRVCRITTDQQFYDLRLLTYVLPGYLAAINAATSSLTVKHLSSRTVEAIPLPLPPLPEQHRIVAAIEEHFSRLDAAVAALQRVRANLKRYRASVLKAACEGRLVPTEAALAQAEGRKYETASMLLARVTGEKMPIVEDLPEG